MNTYLKNIYGDKIFIAPNIPIDKLHNFCQACNIALNPADVVVLADDTVFGSAKEGFALTRDRIIARGSDGLLSCEFAKGWPITLSKTLTGTDVFIKNFKIIHMTMPDYSHLQLLFGDVNEYLKSTGVEPFKSAASAPSSTPAKEGMSSFLSACASSKLDCAFLADISSAQASAEFASLRERIERRNQLKEAIALTAAHLEQLAHNCGHEYLKSELASFEELILAVYFVAAELAKSEPNARELVAEAVYEIFARQQVADFVLNLALQHASAEDAVREFYLRLLLSVRSNKVFYLNSMGLLRAEYSALFTEELASENPADACARKIAVGAFAIDIERLQQAAYAALNRAKTNNEVAANLFG